MKKFILLVTLILLSTAIVNAEVTRKLVTNPDGSREYVFYSENKEIARYTLDDQGNIVRTIGQIPDGVVREYYKSGKLRGEGMFKNGKPEGIAKEYYEGGQLKAEWSIKDNKLDGVSKQYYENGTLRCIDTHKNGQRIKREEYDENGNPINRK
jgi:antitoxin component YwqK of YwqJK toxin-antitoxin module